MGNLMQLALAPAFIFLFYVYVRDKYEKEPWNILVVSVLCGVIAAFIVLYLGSIIKKFEPKDNDILNKLYIIFISSAGIEELMKFIMLFAATWKNKNFNEHFDGIVYAAFIALGFAAVENVFYVFDPNLGGYETAIRRALYSVPGHALFGISMGYYYANARFNNAKRKFNLTLAIFVPWALHSAFNGILILLNQYYLIIFIPYLIFLWRNGFVKMRVQLEKSPFKNNKQLKKR